MKNQVKQFRFSKTEFETVGNWQASEVELRSKAMVDTIDIAFHISTQSVGTANTLCFSRGNSVPTGAQTGTLFS